MEKPKFTRAEIDRWARDNYRLAFAVCQAQAFAECERKRVDEYIQPIFERYSFRIRPEWAQTPGETVQRREDIYLTDEEEKAATYHTECARAHREHGFTGPTGYCPALIAEDLQREAEYELLKSGSEVVGLDHVPCNIDDRKKFLKILIGLCLCVPDSDKTDSPKNIKNFLGRSKKQTPQ